MQAFVGVALSAVLSFANTSPVRGLDAPHRALRAVLESKGVTVPTPRRGAPGTCSMALGSYEPSKRLVQICLKDNNFDSDSLDTLRHEVIHVVQDCRAFRLGDGAMRSGIDIVDSFKRAASVGVDLNRALMPYVQMGADESVLILESEAISGAATMSADEIADQVKEFCS